MIIIIIRFGEWLNLGSEGEFVELNGGGKVLFVLGDGLVKCNFLQLAERGLHLFCTLGREKEGEGLFGVVGIGGESQGKECGNGLRSAKDIEGEGGGWVKEGKKRDRSDRQQERERERCEMGN